MTEDEYDDGDESYTDPVAARLESLTRSALQLDRITSRKAKEIVLDAMASVAKGLEPKRDRPATVTRLGQPV